MVRPFVCMVLFGVLFSGCVKVTADDRSEVQGIGDAELVVLRGTVVSDELFPVVAAVVTLGDQPAVTTDPAGGFEIGDVPLGEYTLTVNASGYEPHSQEVTVNGPTDGLKIALKGIPGDAPYAVTLTHNGFEACAYAALYSSSGVPGACPFGDPERSFKVEVADTWAAGIFELDWESSDEMIFASAVSTEDPNHGLHRAGCGKQGTTEDWCTAMLWGKAPLKIVARPNDTEYAARYALNGKDVFPGGENFTSYILSGYNGYFQTEINGTFFPVCAAFNGVINAPPSWGCPFGIGVSTGTRITYYHTMFYLASPGGKLEDFSALPDQ